MNSNERTVMIVVVSIMVIVIALTIAYAAGSLVARQECEALGFEFGILVLYPEWQAECECRTRVPLREVIPPINGGTK